MLKNELRGRKNRNITINGCRRKISPKKVGIRQMLHSYETRHFPPIDLAEQILQASVSTWTDSGKNMSERLPQVPQVSRHRIRSRRLHGKMVGKKLVATTVSSREVGLLKRREEGKTMSSRVYTETHKDQRDDKRKGNGGGRQKLKHVDGDFPPCCVR